jgi:hypothetical protein
MTDTRPPCTATKKDGTPCRGFALPGKTVCFSHVRTGEEQSEHARKAQVAQVRARKAKKRDMHALRREVTEARALDIAARCLSGVPIAGPDSPRNHFGRRDEITPESVYVGLLILLILTGPHTSPSAARAALEEAVPPSMRPTYVPPPDDIYRAGRGEWRKASVKYREATGLFVSAYPPNLIAPWEDAYEVTKREPLPTFEGWQVEPLGDSITHVLAISPQGEEVIVRRDEVGEFSAAVA